MNRSLVPTIAAAAFILSAGAVLSQRSLQAAFSEARVGFARERKIMAASDRALKLTVDLETGVRGYLLTGDAAFLEPYRNARAALPPLLAALRDEVASDPQRQARVTQMEQLIAAWQAQVGTPEIALAGEQPPPARLAPELRLGKQRMDEIRAAFAAFMSDEATALERLQQRLEGTARVTERLVAFVATMVGLSALALGLLLALQVRRGVQRLVAASQKLARGEFATPIPDERDAIAPLAASLRLMATSLNERERHAQTLLAVSRLSSSDLQTLLSEVRQALQPVLDVSRLSLIEIEPPHARRVASWPVGPLSEAQLDTLEGSAIARVAASGELLVVDDVGDDLYPENRVARAMGVARFVILPLRIDGEVTRVLTLVPTGAAPLSAEARRFLSILGQQLSTSIANTQLTQQLESRNQELERASRAKSEFLAMMSHELRTPLNSIIGFSDVLVDGKFGSLGERQGRYVRHINDSGRHLLRLINELLDMSKIEAGRLEIVRERCAVRPLIIDAIAQLQPLADEKEIRLELPSERAPPYVLADPLRVTQVLFNLLSNAIKFTPRGGRVGVSVALLPSLHDLRITVADSGPGIDADDLRKLFLPFSQLANARNEPRAGTGLGLALVKQLVELMDGHVEVDSQPGRGSRFFVDLRVAPVEEERPSSVPADAPLALIVDDDPAARELMQLTLESAQFRAHTVANGEAALAAARALKPAIILLDVFLPDRDGWNVLRALRADAETANIPVVLVTISTDRRRSFQLGAIDHLVKPIVGDALLAALARRSFTTKVKERVVRVLVVDDDPSHCELMRATLEPRGFVVRIAMTGSDGLALARAEPFDLVLLDLVLPDISGAEVAMALRADERTRQIPILLLTANQIGASERARLNGSVQAVLAKSDTGPTALLSEVRRVLGES